MTNQEINERVAKLCGWFSIEDTESGLWHLSNTKGKTIGYRSGLSEDHAWRVLTPNYAESLDACREFMSQIKGEDQDLFAEEAIHLHRIAPLYEYEFWFAVMTLTPLELCECFLKLKGQWDEN